MTPSMAYLPNFPATLPSTARSETPPWSVEDCDVGLPNAKFTRLSDPATVGSEYTLTWY